jgi:hypothetical protein
MMSRIFRRLPGQSIIFAKLLIDLVACEELRCNLAGTVKRGFLTAGFT